MNIKDAIDIQFETAKYVNINKLFDMRQHRLNTKLLRVVEQIYNTEPFEFTGGNLYT